MLLLITVSARSVTLLYTVTPNAFTRHLTGTVCTVYTR